MNRGIYPPLAGAITLERRLEVLSHNIGNIQTTGFKKDKPIFATVLGQTSGPSVAGIDLFPLISGLPPDRSQGVRSVHVKNEVAARTQVLMNRPEGRS